MHSPSPHHSIPQPIKHHHILTIPPIHPYLCQCPINTMLAETKTMLLVQGMFASDQIMRRRKQKEANSHTMAD
jgi:hypothetical protein